MTSLGLSHFAGQKVNFLVRSFGMVFDVPHQRHDQRPIRDFDDKFEHRQRAQRATFQGFWQFWAGKSQNFPAEVVSRRLTQGCGHFLNARRAKSLP